MAALWKDLKAKEEAKSLSVEELRLFKKLIKAVTFLAENPRHPGLNSHQISELSDACGFPVWESYLENRTPRAARLFWAYGPSQGVITIMGLEPHPESGRGGYRKVVLSKMRAILESVTKKQKR